MTDHTNSTDELERRARESLVALHREYQAAAAPYIKILTDIWALRPLPPLILIDLPQPSTEKLCEMYRRGQLAGEREG